jgi:hypothetical protein
MKEGFLLDGIDVHGDRLSVDEQVQRAIQIPAHAALAGVAWLDGAKVLTDLALRNAARKWFGKIRLLVHRPSSQNPL